ncbi:hypothetical protein GUJ93_ZPchr0004g38968 [Zizania palustris]|uniref:Uncharacterized protein n=1 Tax=Zizania palustris TaxID=103762 RepID=A0A8J5SNG6_ZIZPA|nr:hypothetical protein GUJ93_ZPchr0004g38968 [Zizania palustris]
MAPFQMRYGLRMSPSSSYDDDDDEEEEEEDEEEEFDDEEEMESEGAASPPLMLQAERGGGGLVGAVVGVLRRSLVMCTAGAIVEEDEEEEDSEVEEEGMEIGRPTNVKHVSHVTFDRYGGFLGLPADLEPDVPLPTPSASASVFGVSPTSLQSSYDQRGNSVPTILLMIQRKLYQREGLKIEGIFRINAENSQEICVRELLNSGVVPDEVDLHCLAGLIKAWFRELPTGILDPLTPEQVMHCNTEDECALLACMLPPVEGALLDWAINLMADVVEHENYNKMNARNIAMVFAPNMTQMTDPLTALMHAVQVMNFLKTLILKTLKEREAAGPTKTSEPCSGSPNYQLKAPMPEGFLKPIICSNRKDTDHPMIDMATSDRLLFGPKQFLHRDAKNSFEGPNKRNINHQKWHREVLHQDANNSFEGPQNWHREVLHHDTKNSFEGPEKRDIDHQKWHREFLHHDTKNSFEGPEKRDIDHQKWHREFLHHDTKNSFEGPEKRDIDHQKWHREFLHHDTKNSFEGPDKRDIDHQKWHRELIHHDTKNSFEGPERRDVDHQKWHREVSSLGRDSNNSSGKEFGSRNAEGLFDKFSFRKGVERLCRHPVFQLSRSMKKSADVVFDAPGEARQAWEGFARKTVARAMATADAGREGRKGMQPMSHGGLAHEGRE